MGTVTVATFNARAGAEELRKRLEALYIPAEIDPESSMQRLWLKGERLEKVRLKVPTSRYATVVRLIREWEAAEGPMPGSIRCPECGSGRVVYPQFTRKFFLPNLIGLLSGLGMVEKKFYCEDCQYTWPKDLGKPRKVRHNMAPFYFIQGFDDTEPHSTRK